MADVIYSASAELEEMATKLQARYSPFLGHVDLELIQFAEKSGTKPKKGKIAEISGISSAWVRDYLEQFGNTKLYCLAVWGEEWDELSPAAREWGVFKLLYSVSDNNDGKLKRPDVNEFGILLEYFCSIGVGPHWEQQFGLLPSLLDSLDPLPLPYPQEAFEELGEL